MVLVEEQLEKNGIFLKPKAETVDAVEEVKPEEVVELRPPKVCPGASPALLQKQMSKSALRRLKRKQTGAGEKEEDDEGETKTESTATITTSSVVTTAIVTPAPAVVKPVETLSMADLMMMDDFTTPGSPFQLSSLSKLTLGTNSVPATAPIAATSTSTTNLTPSAKPAASFASTPALPPGLWTEAKNEVHSTSIPSATNAPTASTASDGKYYKSRSGFSVRL